MFALIKFLFFTFVAVAVGIFIGTVPVGGRTIADRLVSLYESTPKLDQLTSTLKGEQAPNEPAAKPGGAKQPASAPAAAAPTPAARHAAAAGPVTPGAANRPDSFSNEDRDEVERIIAARRAKK